MFTYLLIGLLVLAVIVFYIKYKKTKRIKKLIRHPTNYKKGKVILEVADSEEKKYLGLHPLDVISGQEPVYEFTYYSKPNHMCIFDCHINDVDRLYDYYKNSRSFMFMKEDAIKEKIKGIDFIDSPYLNQAVNCCELIKNEDGSYSLRFKGRQFCGAYEKLCDDNGKIKIEDGEPIKFNVINI
jgi:hypothetical protein